MSGVEVGDAIYEIGGPRVMSCGDMMLEYARLRGLKRYLVPVPLHARLFRGLLRNIGRRAVVWDAASQ